MSYFFIYFRINYILCAVKKKININALKIKLIKINSIKFIYISKR